MHPIKMVFSFSTYNYIIILDKLPEIMRITVIFSLILINFQAFSESRNLMEELKKTLDYTARRQKVLAENIAHYSVPGYEAKDVVKPESQEKKIKMHSVMLSSPRHIMTKGAKGEKAQRQSSFD